MSPVAVGPELTQEAMGIRMHPLSLPDPLAPSSSPSCLPLAFPMEMCRDGFSRQALLAGTSHRVCPWGQPRCDPSPHKASPAETSLGLQR